VLCPSTFLLVDADGRGGSPERVVLCSKVYRQLKRGCIVLLMRSELQPMFPGCVYIASHEKNTREANVSRSHERCNSSHANVQ